MSKQEPKDLAISLKIESLSRTLDLATSSLKEFTNLAQGSKEIREWAENEITKYALSLKTSKLDRDELENFFKYPYCIMPGKHDGEYYLAIPKFIDAQFGWLEKVTPSFNIFLVNKYVDWLGELPQALKKELKFPDPLDIYLEGDHLVGRDISKAHSKYSQFIRKKEKDGRLLVDKSKHFELLANLIKDGILPFVPKPVAAEDKVNRYCDFTMRDYQEQAYNEFLKYSNIGAFFPPSTGKTFLGLWAMTHVKGPHLVVVPSRLLVEQWTERIQLYTDLKPEEYDVFTYFKGIKTDKKYKLMIIDEVHHLPSNEFSKLSAVHRDYCIGLSATPQREDSREEFIFALTGKPVGLAWEVFKKLGIITNPPLHVWIVKTEAERIRRVDELLKIDKKTIIFADSIEMGKTYSKRFEIPHIYGDTKQRLSRIMDNQVAIVSRVGDEGVSIPDIERVIEISWLYGSRRQELQRFTRLLHGQTQGEGHIIMTVNEYAKDHKRLFSVMDKGFKIVLHREGISEKVIEQAKQTPRERKPKMIKAFPKEQYQMTAAHPILSLPGIKKKTDLLNKTEKRIVELLYNREKEDFTKEGIAILMGLSATGGSFGSYLSKLRKMNLITVKDGKWKADLSLLGLTK